MSIDYLKCGPLIIALFILCACSGKKEESSKVNLDTPVNSKSETKIPDGPSSVDHSESPNKNEINPCLKKFFKDNPPTNQNALIIGAKAIKECNAKPGDIAMFVTQNFQ